MKIKTSELTGAALDWAVAKCEGIEVRHLKAPELNQLYPVKIGEPRWQPSTNWAQGGPIIEREWDLLSKESTCVSGGELLSYYMLCYVASKLGDEVEVPDELK